MKEFIEKLIERLEEEIQDVSESQGSYEVGSDMSITCSHIIGTLRDVKNRIIPKLAEEYYANTPQKSAGGWIPVTERLPDNEYETVLAVSKQEDGYYYFVAVYTSKHGFRTEDCGVYEEPTAWLPLPELYKPQAEQ